MAPTTHLYIEHPNDELFTTKEVSDPKKANATSSIVPSASSSVSRENLGEDFVDYEWNGGPILIKGVVSPTTKAIGLELFFNEGDAGTRLIGVFWGNLDKDKELQIKYSGSTNMRLDVSLREGKYVWADAARDHWSKKRVIVTLTGSVI